MTARLDLAVALIITSIAFTTRDMGIAFISGMIVRKMEGARLRKTLNFISQVIILWAIYWIGSQVALLLGIPIPGNVLGMILLFGLLCCGILKLQHIELATNFLLKHMIFFFIPFAVGLMNWGSLFYDNSMALASAIIIGAIIPFLTVGFLMQWFERGRRK